MHPDESASIFDGSLQLLQSLFGLFGIAGTYVAIEFNDDGLTDCFLKPLNDMLFEPRARFFVERYLQRGMSGFGIGIVRENHSLECKTNHAVLRIVGDKETTIRIVQVIRVKCPMFANGRFDAIVFRNESWRGIERWVQSGQASERDAVKCDIDWPRIGTTCVAGLGNVHRRFRLSSESGVK